MAAPQHRRRDRVMTSQTPRTGQRGRAEGAVRRTCTVSTRPVEYDELRGPLPVANGRLPVGAPRVRSATARDFGS